MLIGDSSPSSSDADYAKVNASTFVPLVSVLIDACFLQAPELPFPSCWFDVADVIRWA